MLLIAIICLIIGFAVLAWAADRLILGASNLALRLNISALTIGITVVAIGTSLPEIVVSTSAAIAGSPAMAIGNAIGSNIANITLVLGVTALIIPLQIKTKILFRELPVLFLVMVLVSLLMFDGVLGRADGFILLLVLIVLFYWLFKKAKAAASLDHDGAGEVLSIKLAWFWLAVGVVFLPLGSMVIVKSAVFIAKYFGVSNLVIGLTIFALGTSLPELATCLAGARKRQYDLVVGNIIGSNIFNLVAVLLLPAMIHPIPIQNVVLYRDIPVMFGVSILLYLMAYGFKSKGRLARLDGVILVASYIAYIFLVAL